MRILRVVSLIAGLMASQAFALDVGQKAPEFTLKNQNGEAVKLADSKGKQWTVLFFYPKADTPGCTKQACAFRDSLKAIEKENARIYGISTSEVADLKAFEKKYQLNFTLLSDPEGATAEQYGALSSIPLVKIANRHTFIVDPDLTVRAIDRDVDPVMDAKKVAAKLIDLQKATPAPAKKPA